MRVRVAAKRRRRCIGPQVVHGFDAGCGPPSHPATQPPSHPGSKLSAARRAHRLAAPRSVHTPRCVGRRDTICGGRGGSRDITCTIASRDIDRWWQLVAEHDLRRAWGDVAVLVVSCYRFHPGPAPQYAPRTLSLLVVSCCRFHPGPAGRPGCSAAPRGPAPLRLPPVSAEPGAQAHLVVRRRRRSVEDRAPRLPAVARPCRRLNSPPPKSGRLPPWVRALTVAPPPQHTPPPHTARGRISRRHLRPCPTRP